MPAKVKDSRVLALVNLAPGNSNFNLVGGVDSGSVVCAHPMIDL